MVGDELAKNKELIDEVCKILETNKNCLLWKAKNTMETLNKQRETMRQQRKFIDECVTFRG